VHTSIVLTVPVNPSRWTGPLVVIVAALRASVAAWPFRSFDVAAAIDRAARGAHAREPVALTRLGPGMATRWGAWTGPTPYLLKTGAKNISDRKTSRRTFSQAIRPTLFQAVRRTIFWTDLCFLVRRRVSGL